MKTPSKMWGGRFSSAPSDVMQRINVSLDFDRHLYEQDIEGSKAHATMLAAVGLLEDHDLKQILTGLDKVKTEIETGSFPFRNEFEDIHMNIEARLSELIGEAAGRLHTARSRNDQTVTDLKLWLRDVIDRQIQAIRALQEALVAQAEQNLQTVMPGYTHLQTAQPVSFAMHLMAYVEMLERDYGRIQDARVRMNQCPLGAAALAGTSFPIDRHQTAELLGFDKPTENAMDSVASRDFILEYLAAASILSVHCSRFAEEIVLWMNDRFQFITLPDSLTTGSSIMPQKRNPDAAELVRAKPGRIVGALNGLLLVLKGLPMTYSKDLQEDKQPLFDAVSSLDLVLEAMLAMSSNMQANPQAMRDSLNQGHPCATDLADWLVRHLGIPFRKAHHITGSLVKLADEQKISLEQLTLDEMQKLEPAITKEIYSVLNIESALTSRKSYGGTAPATVQQAIDRFKSSW